MIPGSKNSEPYAFLYIGRTNMLLVSPSQDRQYAQFCGEQQSSGGKKKTLYSLLDTNLTFI